MATYMFRPATHDDLPMLRRWRRMAHVVEYWGSPELEDPAETLADNRVAAWVVSHKGRAFAYAQDYDPHDWDPHPFHYLPSGARGIDQYIGEPDMVGRGHGPAFVRRHCELLFARGVPVIGTDPNPENTRAICAYEKAGFRVVSGPVDTRWGRAILMEKRPSPSDHQTTS